MTKRVIKRLEKREKRGKEPIDFSDPIEKWKWFAIVFGGGGILLMILGGAIAGGVGGGFGLGWLLWFLGSLAFIAGVAALVIWLIKINE